MPFVGADFVVEVVLKGLGFGLKCLKDWQVNVVLFLLVFVGHGFDEDGNNFADFDDVVFDFLHGCSMLIRFLGVGFGFGSGRVCGGWAGLRVLPSV